LLQTHETPLESHDGQTQIILRNKAKIELTL